MGFHQMTPVQASTVPLFMKHKDVVVEVSWFSGSARAQLDDLLLGSNRFWQDARLRGTDHREIIGPLYSPEA